MKVGVLALQGDFREHALALETAGAEPVEVRRPEHLAGVDAIALPGGESTTLSMLLDSSGLRPALAGRLEDGMPALGTCAGMILLAARVRDGRPDQRGFATIDMTVRRNGFGRQLESFECDLEVTGLTGTVPAVFIRAPVVEEVGPSVEVLASVTGADGRTSPVLCRAGHHLVASFHPELSGDVRIHEMFLAGAASAVGGDGRK
ncbi:MAG: pyridoxal 5'-phosphate synthase glutaminase subunit PdxT [Acidimicrobiales bacterium]